MSTQSKITAKELRQKILAYFERVEQSGVEESKDHLRSLHEPAVQAELLKSQNWINANYPLNGFQFTHRAPAKVGIRHTSGVSPRCNNRLI
jgi:hypothetical protein